VVRVVCSPDDSRGLYGGLVLAPADYQQGDDFRIIYVHAPSAWMSLMVYSTMAISAGVGLIWRIKVSHAVAAACAPIGASFTFVALVTGSLWGYRMWGTYWEWDPRLTPSSYCCSCTSATWACGPRWTIRNAPIERVPCWPW